MAIGKGLITALALFCAGYAAAPYITLWRLHAALRDGDAATLARLVDWASVRQGLKQDIADGIVSVTAPQPVSAGLPPFGSGFAASLAGAAIDQYVTPVRIAAASREMQADAANAAPGYRVTHAFFDDPADFVLRLCDQDDPDGALLVRLRLHGLGWQVVRVRVSQDVMERMDRRT